MSNIPGREALLELAPPEVFAQERMDEIKRGFSAAFAKQNLAGMFITEAAWFFEEETSPLPAGIRGSGTILYVRHDGFVGEPNVPDITVVTNHVSKHSDEGYGVGIVSHYLKLGRQSITSYRTGGFFTADDRDLPDPDNDPNLVVIRALRQGDRGMIDLPELEPIDLNNPLDSALPAAFNALLTARDLLSVVQTYREEVSVRH